MIKIPQYINKVKLFGLATLFLILIKYQEEFNQSVKSSVENKSNNQNEFIANYQNSLDQKSSYIKLFQKNKSTLFKQEHYGACGTNILFEVLDNENKRISVCSYNDENSSCNIAVPKSIVQRLFGMPHNEKLVSCGFQKDNAGKYQNICYNLRIIKSSGLKQKYPYKIKIISEGNGSYINCDQDKKINFNLSVSTLNGKMIKSNIKYRNIQMGSNKIMPEISKALLNLKNSKGAKAKVIIKQERLRELDLIPSSKINQNPVSYFILTIKLQ